MPKKHAPVQEDPNKLKTFPSMSRIGVMHEVRRAESGVIYCTCEGWVNHRKCWHLTVFLTIDRPDLGEEQKALDEKNEAGPLH